MNNSTSEIYYSLLVPIFIGGTRPLSNHSLCLFNSFGPFEDQGIASFQLNNTEILISLINSNPIE